MPKLPDDPAVRTQILGALVDELSGRVAALTALLEVSGALTPENIAKARETLTALAPAAMATEMKDNSPAAKGDAFLNQLRARSLIKR